MPSRDHRRAQQGARHVEDLAHLVGQLANGHNGSVQGQGLIVSRLTGEGGLIVWDADAGRPLLHVTPTAVLYYEAGAWEQRLDALMKEVMA